jgi:hypothetical protein
VVDVVEAGAAVDDGELLGSMECEGDSLKALAAAAAATAVGGALCT